MPAPYAHMKISDEALNRFALNNNIPPAFKSHVERFSRYVHLGSVGPDYPYFDFKYSNETFWADHMHYDHTGDFLRSMTETLCDRTIIDSANEQFVIPFCWTLGYVSHVTADLVVHPVVIGIVGDYDHHKKEHKECEMIQDEYIFHTLTGRDIKDSCLIDELENISDRDNDEFDLVLEEYWKLFLQQYFPDDFRDRKPNIQDWHDGFTALLKEDGWIQKLGRFFDVTYEKFENMSKIDKAYYVARIHTPFGTPCSYDDVFQRAKDCVAGQWELFALAIANREPKIFTSHLARYNLDEGNDDTKRLVFWPEPSETKLA